MRIDHITAAGAIVAAIAVVAMTIVMVGGRLTIQAAAFNGSWREHRAVTRRAPAGSLANLRWYRPGPAAIAPPGTTRFARRVEGVAEPKKKHVRRSDDRLKDPQALASSQR
jgi:hypothetical protein